MENYLAQCKKLSLTARAAVALKIFQAYCCARNVEDQSINEFFEYLWKWPLIEGPDQFEPWEQSRPLLVNYGLGEPANEEIIRLTSEHHIDENDFREMISGIVEILWGSFWGGAEDELSFSALQNVIKVSRLENLPALTPFKFSQFSENSGWGNKLSPEDCEYWKSCA